MTTTANPCSNSPDAGRHQRCRWILGDDRGHDQVQPGRAILQFLVRPVDIQASLVAPTKIGTFQPVEHEEGSLDLADFLKNDVDLVLAFVFGQFAQHRRWRNMPRLQRGDEAKDVPPILADRVGFSRACREANRSSGKRSRGRVRPDAGRENPAGVARTEIPASHRARTHGRSRRLCRYNAPRSATMSRGGGGHQEHRVPYASPRRWMVTLHGACWSETWM